jgi:hypothetical protein
MASCGRKSVAGDIGLLIEKFLMNESTCSGDNPIDISDDNPIDMGQIQLSVRKAYRVTVYGVTLG